MAQTQSEYQADKQRELDDLARSERISELIQRCSRALGKAGDPTAPGGDEWYRYVHRLCQHGTDGHPSLVADLRAFADQPLERYGDDVETDDYDHASLLAVLAGDPRPFDASLPRDRAVVVDGFRALEAVAIATGVLEGEVTTTVPAWEYEHQVGIRVYRAESRASQEADLISDSGEMKATLLTGGQGSGKSTALKTLVEDRLAHGHKVIDLVDFLKAENVTYDVPQQQFQLKQVRREYDLAPAFETGDYDPPDQEIVAPLSATLAENEVPHRDGDPVVRAFTVPASDLTYRQLVMLMPHTTKTQENYLQSAYQTLERSGGGWTLRDMAQTVRRDTNAGESIADRIEQSLKRTQEKPYIRDTETDLTLNWSALMRDTDTVTSFTVHQLAEQSDKLAVTSYLLDRLYEERRRLLREFDLAEYPPLTAVFRELHTIAPHSKSEQDAEKTLQGYMVDTFADLIALQRHANMDIIADTQKFKQQLSSDVAGLFHRVFAFSGQKPDIEQVFRTRVGDTDPAASVAQYDIGECALVSGDGYKMPLKMAPPRSHHVDAKSGEHGFSIRVDNLDDEELGAAPWSAEIPPRLQFDDAPKEPIDRFAYEHITITNDESDMVPKDDVAEAYNKWARANDHPEKPETSVKSWVTQHTDVKADRTTTISSGSKQVQVYRRMKLMSVTTPAGADGGGEQTATSD